MRRVASFCIAAIIGFILVLSTSNRASGSGNSDFHDDIPIRTSTGFRDPMPVIVNPSDFAISYRG